MKSRKSRSVEIDRERLGRSIDVWLAGRPEGEERRRIDFHLFLANYTGVERKRDARKGGPPDYAELPWLKKALQTGMVTERKLLLLCKVLGVKEAALRCGAASSPEPVRQKKDSALADALAKWREAIRTQQRWEPAFPPFGSRPQSSVYQELSLTPLSVARRFQMTRGGEAAESPRLTELDEALTAVSARSILTALEPRSLLVGAPGSGKTSLAKWLLRLVVVEGGGDFEHALYLSLREFSLATEARPEMGFRQYFFGRYVTQEARDARYLSDALLGLESGPQARRVLYVLDGWDEVPAALRPALRLRIDTELAGNRVIVTSRPAGYPAALETGESRSYQLVPLAQPAISHFVAQYCAACEQPAAAPQILGTIAREPGLYAVVSVPFLAMATCEVLLRHRELPTHVRLTQSWLLQQLVDVITEQHNAAHPDAILRERQLQALERFACQLSLVDPQSKRSSAGAPARISGSRAVKQSRFLNELSLEKGRFEFTHLRLQEFLAARQLDATGGDLLARFCKQQLLTVRWSEEAAFLAGLRSGAPAAAEPWRSLRQMIPWVRSERTGAALQRLAHLVASAACVDGGTALVGVDLRELLFQQLLDGQAAPDDVVAILMRLDADYSVRRMREANVDNPLWSRIYRLIPLHVRQRTGLADWVSEHPGLKHVHSIPGFGFFDPEMLDKQRAVLIESNAPRDAHLRAISALANAADPEAITLLAPIVLRPGELYQSAANALARIGGARAASVLVEALIGRPDRDERYWKHLASSLQAGRHGAIEPNSRDRLVEWLIRHRTDLPPAFPFVLEALLGSRVPGAGATIASIVTDTTIEARTRDTAIYLLRGVTEDPALEQAVDYALATDDLKVRDYIFQSVPYVPVQGGHLSGVTAIAERNRVAMGLLARTGARFPNALPYDLGARVVSQLREARSAGDKVACIELWELTAEVAPDVCAEEAWQDAADRSRSRAERLAAMGYLASSRQAVPAQRAQELVLGEMGTEPCATDMLIDISEFLARDRPQLVPWLMGIIMHSESVPVGAKKEIVRSALRQVAAQGWLVHETEVVNPAGVCLPADGWPAQVGEAP